eukprot:8070157-Pyramimonas_sp.AAC.1
MKQPWRRTTTLVRWMRHVPPRPLPRPAAAAGLGTSDTSALTREQRRASIGRPAAAVPPGAAAEAPAL